MNLTGITILLRESRAYQQRLDALRAASGSLNIIRAARPFLLAALAQDWNAPVIYLTAKVKRAYNVAEQLPVWLGEDAPVYRFAEPAPGFYERAAWGESTVRARIQTLAALLPPEDAQHTQNRHPVVIASARAWMQRTLPVNHFRRGTMVLELNQRQNINKLLDQWVKLGYEPASIVTEPGKFSRRGGVLDIFPMAAEQPVRIDFFDDEIDTLRVFDVSTQRSSSANGRLVITPARETLPENAPSLAGHLNPWFSAESTSPEVVKDAELLDSGTVFAHIEHYLPYLYPNAVNLLDYAPLDALIVIEDLDELRETVNEHERHAIKAREENEKAGRIAPDHPQPYLTWDALQEALNDRRIVTLNVTGEDFAGVFTPVQRFGGQLKPALSYVRTARRDGNRAVIVSQQIARLTELWREQDTFVPTVQAVTEKPDTSYVALVNGTLAEGWTLNATDHPLHLITDAELFGWNRPEPRRRKSTRPARVPESDYADWQEGEYVVHIDYGIGRFMGMRHRTVDGTEREYLIVEYAGNDTVFVPIHQADRLMRYVGVDEKPPTLSKLGQPDWTRVKSKARKAVEEEAKELLELYAARAKAQGHAYSEDDHWQRELEASFPFVETEDQLRAVREVKADMENIMPMDRLICGDVGYGKTEVALRAAFKAINDGKQVAVLVPTTILAQQHYETFRNRLVQFPIKVELLSRFRTKEEQDRALPKIAAGEIDILVGTHRILSHDVTFKDLGLVIIDEEQRFGVKQKEHFKKLRTQVDVLTLTATPIPRTLYMSLTGVRDISMIQTPPEERIPIITHVGTFDETLIRQAVLRELERGGQVFVVHNRIRTIDLLHDQLEQIVPEARVVTAHGQMNERTLESVMAAFARGEFDILLSTAIIENGIDIPNANTLIVDRADWFGLAQLYQLRGRVGRGAQQAYAYFFYQHEGRLNEEARARLETLAENTGLGAGFQIAMRDLEIRGAGDILSTRQTGHVAAIGLNLYTQLLAQAVQELKGTTNNEPVPVAATENIVLNLPVPAYIPDDWIPEISLRLQIYRRIANLTTQEGIEAMHAELRDRFGQLPAAVEGLLFQIRVKLLAQKIGATAVLAKDGILQVKLPYLVELDRHGLAQQLGDDITVTRTAVEMPQHDGDAWQERLITLMTQLSQGVATGIGM